MNSETYFYQPNVIPLASTPIFTRMLTNPHVTPHGLYDNLLYRVVLPA